MKKIVLFIGLCLFASCGRSANEVQIVVKAGSFDRIDCVVSVKIPYMDWMDSDLTVELVETTAGQVAEVIPCQLMLDDGNSPTLYWILQGKTNAGSSRTYRARKIMKGSPSEFSMRALDSSNMLVLKKNEMPVLNYNYTILPPPPGVDKAYERSGFIHPAYSPSGFVLTAIQPKDHYHHFGIWNPWTRIEYDDAVYDLWNIGDKQGTVRAQKINSVFEGNVVSGFEAVLNHVIFTTAGEKTIMKGHWDVRTWNVTEGFLWDFESNLFLSTSLPITMKEYRYGGFVYRATELWTRDNCEVIASEGLTRSQIDGSTARWISTSGETETGRSGILILGHPDNHNAPQPLRIWDEEANNGRGDVMINFAPSKFTDWILEPSHTYRLRYRIYTYDGLMTDEIANRLWNDFAEPPVVEVVGS
jgi:hypothetical protein